MASVPTKAQVTMICDIYEPALVEVSAIYHVPKTTNDPNEVCVVKNCLFWLCRYFQCVLS